jgi:quercetin dioxygenase-like cupin family protein
MKILTFFLLIISSLTRAQSYQSLDTIKPPLNYDNIYVRPLFHDSLASGFVIFIKKEVKLHKHVNHTEQVVILEGEGTMQLGGKNIFVKKGDIIFIPANTVHSLSVESLDPMKVLSTQSPYFDGKDRELIQYTHE